MRPPDPRTVGLFVCLAVLYLYPLFYFPINNPNERVRIYMTAAMVDYGTFVIGHREDRGKTFKDVGSIYDRWGYVNDKALVCDDADLEPPDCEGPLYSAKAPGTSFLAIPAYMLYRLVGDTEEYRSVTLFLRFAVLLVPGLLFLWGFRRYASRWVEDRWVLDTVTMGLGLGSMFMTYSHMVAGHQLTALLLFVGFMATEAGSRPDPRPRRHLLLALGGLATAMSVVVEYPSVVGAAVVGGMLLSRAVRTRRGLLIVSFTAGCVPPAFLMGWFHHSAFGAPWRTAYATLENPQFVKDIAYGFMGIRAPSLENLEGSFIAPYNGMFFFAPWLVLVLPALGLIPRMRRRIRGAPLGAAAAVVLLFTLFITCHSLWRGGWTLGPRYIVGFVPFAGFLVALGFRDLEDASKIGARLILAALVLAATAVTGICSLVTQGFPTAFYNPLREAALPLLIDGYATRTLGHTLGLSGVWAWLPLLAALAWPVWRIGAGISPSSRAPRLLRPIAVLGSLGLAGILFWALLLPSEPPDCERVGALAWLKEHYEEEGGYPEGQEDLRDLRSYVRAFSNDGLLAAWAATEETRAGKWKKAKKLARRWTDERSKRLQRRGQVGTILASLSPFPGAWAFPLWDPEQFLGSVWTTSRRIGIQSGTPDHIKVSPKAVEPGAEERGVPEEGLEVPLLKPFDILSREALKLRRGAQLWDLKLPHPPGPVFGTRELTGITTEEGRGTKHGLTHLPGERTGVLDGPIREASPRVEDPFPPERVGRTGVLASEAIPAVPDGAGGVQSDQVLIDGESPEDDPGPEDGVDEATIPTDPPEARMDGDGLLHDRGAVDEDPAAETDTGAKVQPDRVETTP